MTCLLVPPLYTPGVKVQPGLYHHYLCSTLHECNRHILFLVNSMEHGTVATQNVNVNFDLNVTGVLDDTRMHAVASNLIIIQFTVTAVN